MSGDRGGNDPGRQARRADPSVTVRVPDRFTVIPFSDNEFRLHSLTYSLAVGDREGLVGHLLSMLQETRHTVAELVEALPAFEPDAVAGAVEQLLDVGALELTAEPDASVAEPDASVDGRRFAPQIRFFGHFTPPADAPATERAREAPRSGADFQALLARAHVLVLGAGRLGSALVRSLLLAGVGRMTVVDDDPVTLADLERGAWFEDEHLGRRRSAAARSLPRPGHAGQRIDAAPEPESASALVSLLRTASLAVVARDHVRPAEYTEVNRAALAAGVPWTSGRYAGFEFHLGPTVLPRETACYTCADLRLRSNLPDLAEHAAVTAYQDRGGRLRDESLMVSPGADLLALEAVKALTLFTSPSAWSAIVVLDLLRMELTAHPVLKIPRCPDCGRPAHARPTVHAWQQRPDAVVAP